MYLPIRVAIGFTLLAVISASAAPPATINLHGQLLDSSGMAVSGSRAYQVTFYDAETGGNVLGTALTGTVSVSDSGLFNLSVTPPGEILTVGEVWYALGVDTDVPADNDASDDLFPTRIRVYSVPFALQAQEVVGVAADRVGSGMVDDTEFDALDGVTGNLQQQIDAVDTSGIAQNTTDIAQNTSDIAANTSAITTNTASIASNTTAIGTKADASAVSQNTTDIATNATNIAANTTALADKANSADVYTQTAADTAFVDAAGDTMSGALGVDTITEATADAGVTAEGLMLKDSYLGLPQISTPGDTANKLYNVAGALFFGGTQLGLSSLDKDSINNAGTLGFDWADGEVADTLTIQGGSVNDDSFSAISDLTAESAIGTGSGQVAAGNHGHILSALGGSVTDGQVPDALTIQGGSVNNDSFSALGDLMAETAIGTASGQVAAGDHGHTLSALSGSVTDGQVPDNITISGVDAADDSAAAPSMAYASDPDTGIHRPGADQLAMVAGGSIRLSVDSAEVNLLGNILEMAASSAPGTTANKLYNTGGDLFWNGTQLNGGGGSSTISWEGSANLSNYSQYPAYTYPAGANPTQTIRHNQLTGSYSSAFPLSRIAREIVEIYIRVDISEAFPGAQMPGIRYAIRDIATGALAHDVTGVVSLRGLTEDTWVSLTLLGTSLDLTVDNTEFLMFETSTISGTDGGTGEIEFVQEVIVQ